MLMFNRKVQHVAVSAKHLHQFELEVNTFLERMVTYDEKWIHYFTQESKHSSTEWHHKQSSPPKEFKTQLSAGKITASVFWDSD
jgi:hypothetical protein